MQKSFTPDINNTIEFNNAVDFCVGTGRMGLALQKEYMEQLRAVQEDIGFKYIRGHGLFSDDMAIYQERKDWDGNVYYEYNFTYLDLVMDNYLKLNIRPFLELGFMPAKLASGDNTIFYWKGNTTPPKDYDKWCELVVITLKHLMERYGADEVVTWPIEVWNEPNLPGFWKDANMEEYLVLFEKTFNAIKALDSRFRIGGPAICGVEDVKHMTFFMDFLDKKKLPIDFITRHHYASEQPKFDGHYAYIQLAQFEESLETLYNSRRIIDSYPDYKGIEMHITEFNTSYVPNAPIHDTNRNAAYVARMLSRLGDMCASYSYWTFGDIFEEMGVPFTPFYGGFGMLANRTIHKPTYYAFKFFKDLQGKATKKNTSDLTFAASKSVQISADALKKDSAEGSRQEYTNNCIIKDDNCVVCLDSDGVFRGVIFNSRVERTGEALDISFKLPAQASKYTLLTKLVDENTCNPLKVWHDFGEPSSLTPELIEILKEADRPLIGTSVIESSDGVVDISFNLAEFGLEYFELSPVEIKSDRGYDYVRVME